MRQRQKTKRDRERERSPLTLTKESPCEHTVRRQPSASQEEHSQEEPTLLSP